MTELALTAAAAGAPGDDDEPEQLGLFGEPQTEAGKVKKPFLVARGPGRPPGSRNRRTERNVQFLLSRHRDPREVLLEIAEANVHDLAGLLGCSVHEALQEKRLAAAAVLPYVAARITPENVVLPMPVHLFVNTGSGDGGGAGGVVEGVVYAVQAEAVSAANDEGSKA